MERYQPGQARIAAKIQMKAEPADRGLPAFNETGRLDGGREDLEEGAEA